MSKIEKVTPIVFKGVGEFEGREYTLEYNRRTVVKAEKAGLDINAVESKPMTMVYIMWWGAFLMHHPYIKQEQTDKILDDQFGGISGLANVTNDKGESLIEHLGKLYSAPFQTLIPDEGEGANPRTVVQF